MQGRAFIPETESFWPEGPGLESSSRYSCPKPENHDWYMPPRYLTQECLPEGWKKPRVLKDLQLVSSRVVQLTILKTSDARGSTERGRHVGSGFITFDPKYGAIVNTSKHVVFDPFEARHTIVKFFYDAGYDRGNIFEQNEIENELIDRILQNDASSPSVSQCERFSLSAEVPVDHVHRAGLFLSRGGTTYFRSVMCSDFTAFSCEIPVHELFDADEKNIAAFSWWNFSLRRVLFAPQTEVTVAVIGHPHGDLKKISFGKMDRLLGLSPSVYDAPTCGGSSGSPVIRLYSDSVHYISAGQFVHHGHNRFVLNKGMGTVRPPLAFPYYRLLDTENVLSDIVSVLYEPIFYWTLFFCDFLHIESTLHSSLDVFAYTSSFTALLLSADTILFKILFTGFWLHLFLTRLLMVKRAGIRFAACMLVSTLLCMSMFLVLWVMLLILPPPWNNKFLASAVWIIVLFVERHYNFHGLFVQRTIGSFPEILRLKLLAEQRAKLRKHRRDIDLDTASVETT